MRALVTCADGLAFLFPFNRWRHRGFGRWSGSHRIPESGLKSVPGKEDRERPALGPP